MKRKTTPKYQATINYHECPVRRVDARLRKLAREWGGKQSKAAYIECFDVRALSFTFPTKILRYRFVQKARTYLKEIEYGLCGFVEFT